MNPTITKSRSVLRAVVEGYEEVEPCIIAALAMRERIFLVGPHGNGKCFYKGTPILMYDGTIKLVEQIVVDDVVMGPDSEPRHVTSLGRGREEMFKIVPSKGDAFVCNKSHILTLDQSPHGYTKGLNGKLFDISLKDFLQQSPDFRRRAMLCRTGVEFVQDAEPLEIPPYLLGLWLGDGTSSQPEFTTSDEVIVNYLRNYVNTINCELSHTHEYRYRICAKDRGGLLLDNHPFLAFLKRYNLLDNKHIPHKYLTASTEDRLQLLAGLIDTDGSLNCNCIDLLQKSGVITEQILFLARSLGLAAYNNKCEKGCMYKGEMRNGIYNRISISGDTHLVPLLLEHKRPTERMQEKNPLRIGIKEIIPLGVGDYYGFELDGPDGRFLLGDFTITHNTTLTKTLARVADKSGRGYRIFHADKADMIALAGIPDMDKWGKSGKPSFLPSETAIWGGKVILVDELPRANKERQNYWLEVIEERTFNGLPVDYDILMATGNDATYQGNFKFDLALLSRFMFVLPAPKFQHIESNVVADMIKLNLDGGRNLDNLSQDLHELIDKIRNNVQVYKQNAAILDQLITFAGTFTQFVKDKIAGDQELANSPEAYICPREFSFHFINALLSLGAYYEAQGFENKFRRAGDDAVKYVFKTRHAGAGNKFMNICDMAWRQLSNMLVDGVDSPAGRLRWKFASAISAAQKTAFWKQYISEACDKWQLDEVTTCIGDTLNQVNKEAVGQIGILWHTIKQEPRVEHVAIQIEGFIISEVARKLLKGFADPASKEAELYNKYKNHVVLKPEDVSCIVGMNS